MHSNNIYSVWYTVFRCKRTKPDGVVFDFISYPSFGNSGINISDFIQFFNSRFESKIIAIVRLASNMSNLVYNLFPL